MPPSLLRRALDGSDRGVEAHAVLTTIAFFVLCLFQGFALWHEQPFQPAQFGQAVAMVLGGGGAGGGNVDVVTPSGRNSDAGTVRANGGTGGRGCTFAYYPYELRGGFGGVGSVVTRAMAY